MEETWTVTVTSRFLRGAWLAVRLPIFVILSAFEWIVSVIFGALAFLGILAAIFFKLFGRHPDFQFLTVLSLAIGCGIFLIAYHVLLQLVARPTKRRRSYWSVNVLILS